LVVDNMKQKGGVLMWALFFVFAVAFLIFVNALNIPITDKTLLYYVAGIIFVAILIFSIISNS
jgi:branched-subunit amino acid transport protein